jgi:hypothetical protein
VTANPGGAVTFVNAIGNIHFTNDTPDGHIFADTTGSSGNRNSVGTGIVLPPDTSWHVFEVRAGLLNRVWAGVAVDGQWNPLAGLPLARIYHPDWGPDLSLILTAESENAYPGSSDPIHTQWTTEYKDPKLYRFIHGVMPPTRAMSFATMSGLSSRAPLSFRPRRRAS